MELRWKLNWKQVDTAQLETAAREIRKLHPALTVSVEAVQDKASLAVLMPQKQLGDVLRTLEPDASFIGSRPESGQPEGATFRVSLDFCRHPDAQLGDFHLELSDTAADNDPCWGVACAIAERVAPIVDGTFIDDEEDIDDL